VVVGEAKPDLRGKELVLEVAYEKTLDGKETFKVTMRASRHGGQGLSTPADQRPSEPDQVLTLLSLTTKCVPSNGAKERWG
jgi:hypothetical protein